jgi:DNA-binding CsgD family transcriptional regulator
LGPLGPTGSAQLVDRIGSTLSVASRQAILEVAAGNPLALEELPRNADQIDPGSPATPLTDRLVTVFGGRLRQLEPPVRTQLLRAALDGVRANASSPEARSRYVMTNVHQAVEQDLLVVDPLGDLVFRHPLVRAAVIHQAGPVERRDAHAHLAGLYDDVLVRRAAHLSAACTTPDQSVAELLDDAARLSIRRGGAAVAVDWLRRAAELSTDSTRRGELRAEAAFVAAQASRFDDAQALVDAVETGSESAAAVLTGAYLALYRDGEVIASHRRILAVLRDAATLDDATTSRLIKLLLAVTQYAGDAELWAQTDAAVDRVAERVDEVVLLYRDAWGDLTRRGHTVRARLAELRDGLALLEPWEVMRIGVTAYYVDGLGDFRATLVRLFDGERDRGAVTNAMTMLQLLLLDRIASGEWAQAQESARVGLELTSTHHNELFRCQFVAYDGVRAASSGDVVAARRCAAEVTAWAGPRRLGLLLGFAQRIAVLTALAEADYAAAYEAAVRIGPPGAFPPYAHQATDGLLDLVEAAIHSGHVVEARIHAEAATRLRLGDISPRLAVLTIAVQAMTASDGAAGELFESALRHVAVAEFPFEQNRIRLEYGMWLRRQRRHTDAREVLGSATDGFEALGARPWAERARSELRAAGAMVKRSGGNTVTMSAQERRIAELAAAGHSNKQIAEQLYLSPRTVGAHLYRIFPKLGVTSRAALGQAMRELPAD